MRTIIFDQSSSCTGFAVLDDNELIEHGNLIPSKPRKIHVDKHQRRLASKANMARRLLEFWNDMRLLIREFDPDEAVMEQIHYHGMHNADSIEPLAGASNLVMMAAVEWGINFYTVRPQSWKAAVGAVGKKDTVKSDIAHKVCLFWGLDRDVIKSSDHSDALGIAAYWTRFQDDVRRGLIK